MKRLSAAARISLALVCLTVTLLLLGQSFFSGPDPNRARLADRAQLAQSIAISFSTPALKNDTAAMRTLAQSLLASNNDLLSVAIQGLDGTILYESDGHADGWKPIDRGASTATQVQIDLLKDGKTRFATLQLRFRPLPGSGIVGWLNQPTIRLILFVACAGFVLYVIYLRKTLRLLDPSAVIPDRVKAMLETLAEGVLVLDADQRVVLANNAFAALVGRTTTNLQGVEAASLRWSQPHSDTAPEVYPWAEALRTGQAQRGIPLNLAGGPDGSRIVTINCAPIVGGENKSRGVLVTIDDVTVIEAKNGQLKDMLEMLRRSRDEIDRQNKELQTAATTDPLTGCRNRRSFYKDFQAAWNSGRRYNHEVAVVMVDVDHFKKVNDVHGHAVGDQVLQHVAGILQSLARDTDLVARYGGEEFCILLPQCDVEQAAMAAERYRQAIESKPCGAVNLTASFGCSAMHLKAETPALMLDQADKALYAAKRTGRNRVMRFDRMPSSVEPQADDSRELHEPRHARDAQHVGSENTAGTPIAFHAVTALMSALAHRDKATADHSRRVADLCVAVGRGLLSLRDCFVLEVAAMLHDVGKLGVPDAILYKPGPLTEEEWAIMQQHDLMGMEITAAAFGSNELTRIIRTHHAFFGGDSRDPSLPKGHDIPIEARILSIADAFDAMTSHRPYRRQRSAEEAFAELRRCAEKQFDPELVEHFIKAIRHTQRDPIQSADEDFMQELDEALQSDEVVEQIDNAAALAKSLSSGGRRIVSPTLEDETELDLGEAPAPVAPGPRLEQQLSQQKYLRLRLEIERLACTFETGNVAALSAMADHLHELAAAEGIKDIADRARFLERSARVADAHTVIQTVNELLRLCDSAQRLDEGMSQAIRRAFAWQMRSSEERSASAAAPAAAKMDMRLPSNPTERARRWGLMTPPAPTPAPAPASDPAPAAAPPPQPQRKVVHSPFAVQPITVFADAPAAEADPSRPLHAVRVSGIAA